MKNPITGAIKHHFKKLVHHLLANPDKTPNCEGKILKNQASGDKIKRIHNQKFLIKRTIATAPKTIVTSPKNMRIKTNFKNASPTLPSPP